MTQLNQEHKTQVKEATSRPDSLWLSLEMGKAELHEHEVMSLDEAVACNGDFGNLRGLVVTGVPLYGDEPLDAATRYIFNQIEIFEKIKENKELKKRIGSGL